MVNIDLTVNKSDTIQIYFYDFCSPSHSLVRPCSRMKSNYNKLLLACDNQ